MSYLYKFKSAYDRDIDALENDELWVSTLAKMNDPMDLGFYIAKGLKYSDTDIVKFQNALNQSFVIISLAKKVQNRRLWNYYTDGMKGFALAYRSVDLQSALIKLGANRPIAKRIVYGASKLDLSEMIEQFLMNGVVPNLKDATLLFQKDTSWSSEDEYRIVTNSNFLAHHDNAVKNGGILLKHVVPAIIYIGYRMKSENVEKVVRYADKRKIVVRRLTPNFRSASSIEFKSIVINGTHIGDEQLETISDEILNYTLEDISELLD